MLSFKLVAAVILFAAGALNQVSAATIPDVDEVKPEIAAINPIGDVELWEACKKAIVTDKDIYGGTRYGEHGEIVLLKYDQCVPFHKDGKTATGAVFCQPTTCNFYLDSVCTQASTEPAPLFIPASSDIPNAVNFANVILGHAAVCRRNGVPDTV